MCADIEICCPKFCLSDACYVRAILRLRRCAVATSAPCSVLHQSSQLACRTHGKRVRCLTALGMRSLRCRNRACSLSCANPCPFCAVVSNIVSNAESHVEAALGDTVASLYAAVALELLHAPGHAVPISVLHQKHSQASPTALLEANYIALQDAVPLGAQVQDPLSGLYLGLTRLCVVLHRVVVQHAPSSASRLVARLARSASGHAMPRAQASEERRASLEACLRQTGSPSGPAAKALALSWHLQVAQRKQSTCHTLRARPSSVARPRLPSQTAGAFGA